jgi:surface antigen
MAVAAGTLLGAYIGGQVGESLDKADIEYARQAEMRAAVVPLRQQIVWSNPQTGHSGTVTPIREGRDPLGNYCREYQTTVTIGGRVEQAYGTACRQPDGSWKVIDS